MVDREFQKLYTAYKRQIERSLTRILSHRSPATIFHPIQYVLGSGGKRVRAVLMLLACEAVGGASRGMIGAAVAIEMLHNFTLVHDDVMDHAHLRRGKQTIHEKWDENVAILAGDEMIALAYRSLMTTRTHKVHEMIDAFTDAFVTVCEGQAYDKEFEYRKDVAVQEYVSMIEKKTARMISASTEIGALIGGGTPRQVESLKLYGHHLGIAFQMKDDLLDIAGDPDEFGKMIGGDVREGKKTFLLLKAIEQTRGSERAFLMSITPKKKVTRAIIHRVHDIYKRSGVLREAHREIERHTRLAQRSLASVRTSKAREMLLWLSAQLLHRMA